MWLYWNPYELQHKARSFDWMKHNNEETRENYLTLDHFSCVIVIIVLHMLKSQGLINVLCSSSPLLFARSYLKRVKHIIVWLLFKKNPMRFVAYYGLLFMFNFVDLFIWHCPCYGREQVCIVLIALGHSHCYWRSNLPTNCRLCNSKK